LQRLVSGLDKKTEVGGTRASQDLSAEPTCMSRTRKGNTENSQDHLGAFIGRLRRLIVFKSSGHIRQGSFRPPAKHAHIIHPFGFFFNTYFFFPSSLYIKTHFFPHYIVYRPHLVRKAKRHPIFGSRTKPLH
jgi:hypothetical protein